MYLDIGDQQVPTQKGQEIEVIIRAQGYYTCTYKSTLDATLRHCGTFYVYHLIPFTYKAMAFCIEPLTIE